MWATEMTAANPKHNQEKDHKPRQSNSEQRNGCISDGLPTKKSAQQISYNATKCKQTIELHFWK
jgi:hypothetical protein